MSIAKVRRLLNNRFLYGVPFLVLLVAGSFGLQHFSQLRYTFRKKKMLTRQEAEDLLPQDAANKLSSKMKSAEESPTIEHEYEKLKDVDVNNWVNIRGPRPWEDSKSIQLAQKQSIVNNT